MKRLDTLVLHGYVEDGQLILDNLRYFKGMILMYEDTKVRVVIERAKENKINAHRRDLFEVCYQLISEHTGYTVQEVDAIQW